MEHCATCGIQIMVAGAEDVGIGSGPFYCLQHYVEEAERREAEQFPESYRKVVRDIPQQPQRQDSLDEQLLTLTAAANKLGCYDAADYIRDRLYPIPRKAPS